MLYIMRHGETDWNAQRKLQGRSDIPLNEAGRAMAVNAGRESAAVPLDVCYCSPLIRARETAELVLRGRAVPIITDERLVEISFGIYEGTANSFQLPDCPINVLFQAPENYTVPVEEGESFRDLYSRTGSFLREEIQPRLERGENVLIVGHGITNSSIMCQMQGIPLERMFDMRFDHCQLVRVV